MIYYAVMMALIVADVWVGGNVIRAVAIVGGVVAMWGLFGVTWRSGCNTNKNLKTSRGS